VRLESLAQVHDAERPAGPVSAALFGRGGADGRLDALRVVACLMVVLLHVSAQNYHAFGPRWSAALVLDSLVRASVPIFFMLSGATLLYRDESLGAFFRKRVLRIVPPLIFWSGFYLAWLAYNGVDVGNWVVRIVSGPTMYHLWYFYAALGIYTVVPAMRVFVKGAPPAVFAYVLLAWLAFSTLLPTLETLWADSGCLDPRPGALSQTWYLGQWYGYGGFVLLGAWMVRRPPGTVRGIALFAVGVACTIAASWWRSHAVGAPCESFFVYLTPFVAIAAAGLFGAFVSMSAFQSPRWLRSVSDCTLGVYGLHAFVIDPVLPRLGITATDGDPWLRPVAMALAAFSLSLA